MEAAACTELVLAPSSCLLFPPSEVLVCSPSVICGQWRVGQPVISDDTGWGPATCTPLNVAASASTPFDLVAAVPVSLDLDPLVCLEA